MEEELSDGGQIGFAVFQETMRMVKILDPRMLLSSGAAGGPNPLL